METYFPTQTIGKNSKVSNQLSVNHRNEILPGMTDPILRRYHKILLL